MICCSSNDASSDEEGPYSTILTVRRRHVTKWSINTVNEFTLLQHVEEMPEINTCMYYIGRAFTYLLFHMWDD